LKEERIQFEIVMWLQKNGYWFFSVPNEGARDMTTRLKAMGLRPGASDLVVVLPQGRCLFVEVKSETGLQRKEQKLFQEKVEERGHRYVIVRSLEDVKAALC